MMWCHRLPVSCYSSQEQPSGFIFTPTGRFEKLVLCLFVGSNVKQNKAPARQLFVPHFAALYKDDPVLLRSSHCLSRKCFSPHAAFAVFFFRLLLTYGAFFCFFFNGWNRCLQSALFCWLQYKARARCFTVAMTESHSSAFTLRSHSLAPPAAVACQRLDAPHWLTDPRVWKEAATVADDAIGPTGHSEDFGRG